MTQEIYTELRTLSNKELQIEVITDKTKHQEPHTVEKRLRGDNLRFIPKSMVKVEKSSKDIKKEKIQSIMIDISVGNLQVAKDELEKLFG